MTLSHFEDATDSQTTKTLVIFPHWRHWRQILVGREFESHWLRFIIVSVDWLRFIIVSVGLASLIIIVVTVTIWTRAKVEMWWYIVAAVGLAALLIVIVAVIGWKKTKGGRPRMDDGNEQGLNPAVTQPGPENTADREEDVSYASVSYSKNTNSKRTPAAKP
ncbi:hypothetical protein F7725_019993, partial [Dissostichus mawsoni]